MFTRLFPVQSNGLSVNIHTAPCVLLFFVGRGPCTKQVHSEVKYTIYRDELATDPRTIMA